MRGARSSTFDMPFPSPGARNEMISLAERIGKLQNHEALQALELCRKVVAGFELKGCIENIQLNDLVQLGLSLGKGVRR